MSSKFLIPLTFLLFLSCDPDPSVIEVDPATPPSILEALANNYQQLPEEQISISQDETLYTQYAGPTERYRHGILGDIIEASELVAVKNGNFYLHTLKEEYVFEDIRPRLYDVTGDGALELVCIRTHANLGAGIAIYTVSDAGIEEYAHVAEIGTPNRWLNIVAVDDLDNDGTIEIAWIETPHIGGILKVAPITKGALKATAEIRGYSNHAIGETNLCLSVLTNEDNQKIIYVPNQNRNKIVGFQYENETLRLVDEIEKEVSFQVTLKTQHNFSNIVEGEDNCIF